MAQEVRSINPSIRFLPEYQDEDRKYTFAIIVARYQGSWIWVRHKERVTWELPAGHVEAGETVDEAAHRELYEETGAINYTLKPVVTYQGMLNGEVVYGKIFLAEVHSTGPLPEFEIAEIQLFGTIPESLTYPELQPLFFQYTMDQINEDGFVALTKMPNIGITLAEHLIQADIKNPEEFLALGCEKTFLRIHALMPDACVSHLYALEGAIQGVRWHTIEPGRKEELRHFFNQLNPSSF